MKIRKKKDTIEKIATDEFGINRKFNFNLVDYTPRDAETSICVCCPYFNKCDKFPDPELMKNKYLNFEDYCNSFDEGQWILIPEEGTIEKAGLKFEER